MSACSFLYLQSSDLILSSETASISAARTAALSPRSRPTAATGIPGGICTIDRIASMLTAPLTGTPITGLTVNDATTPGSAADSPAMAMNTSESLPFTSSSTLPGVRWADATAMSYGIPNLFRTPRAFSATGRSLLLPIITDTLDIVTATTPYDNNFSGRRFEERKVKGFLKPVSALENHDEEYSYSDEGPYEDADEIDDGAVKSVVERNLAERGYVAPSGEIGPDDTDDETDDSHHGAERPALSRAEHGGEHAGHEHDQRECEDYQGHECHEIHFSASVFRPQMR